MAIELECLLFWGQSVLVMRLYYCYFKHIFLFVKKKKKGEIGKKHGHNTFSFTHDRNFIISFYKVKLPIYIIVTWLLWESYF